MLFIASIVFTSLEAYAYFYKTPLYRGDTTLLLIKQTDSSDSITQNDITLNQKLVSTYSQIVKSRRVLDQVITNLNLNYSVGQLSSKVEVTSVQNTEIIKISVIDESNEMAAFIANTVAEVFTKEIVDIFALIQQIDGIENKKVEQLKREVIKAVQNGAKIPELPTMENSVKDNISIEEMYELTKGFNTYYKTDELKIQVTDENAFVNACNVHFRNVLFCFEKR